MITAGTEAWGSDAKKTERENQRDGALLVQAYNLPNLPFDYPRRLTSATRIPPPRPKVILLLTILPAGKC